MTTATADAVVRPAIGMTAARPRPGHTDLDPTAIGVGGDMRGRRAIWGARSADGQWSYRFVEDGSRTVWDVCHLETGRVHLGEPSLIAAREGTCTGRILAALDRADLRAAAPRCSWRGQWTGATCHRPAQPGGTRCNDPKHKEAA